MRNMTLEKMFDAVGRAMENKGNEGNGNCTGGGGREIAEIENFHEWRQIRTEFHFSQMSRIFSKSRAFRNLEKASLLPRFRSPLKSEKSGAFLLRNPGYEK